MGPLLLRLRWSWRDLRARWLQVAAIALVIGIGSGMYSGLSSSGEWRLASYDASFEQLGMWDLDVAATEGTVVPEDQLRAVVAGLPSADAIESSRVRLIAQTQVDASTADQVILVPGKLVGLGPESDEVARVEAVSGRGLEPGDRGAPTAVLDEHFAAFYDLPERGTVRVAGGVTLDYVGRGLVGEDLLVIPPRGTVFGESGYAILWASLETVQEITGQPGQVNDLVVRVVPGTDLAALEAELLTALGAAFPDASFTVTPREENVALRMMYDDIEGDRRFYNVFAVLILAGAAFAAFNLTSRIVQAQRREIGIGMALGVPPPSLAVRPLLVGTQIALLGVVFGVVVGYIVQAALAGVLADYFPLPQWITEFQPSVFLRGAVLGFVLPLLATVLPIVSAVRTTPVDAISTAHRTASGGLAPLVRRVPLPGSSITQLPLRNTLREPRRTLLTALGIAAAIATLVGVIGMIDSYLGTLDEGTDEILGDQPERLSIDLSFAPVDSPDVQAVLDAPVLADAEAGLVLGGTLDPTGEQIDVFLTLLDFDSPLWTPTLVAGELSAGGEGIVLAEKAADDLDVDVGDTVSLRHPVREGLSYRLVDSEAPVAAIHPSPLRNVAYFDLSQASLFDLEGITNSVRAVPAPGVSPEQAQQALFGRPGVVSVQKVRAQADALRSFIEEFVGVFNIVEAAVLVLAVLIAFNATSINVDERRREHATMFAFGLRVRAVLGVSIVESLVVGVIGTAVGVVAGRLLVGWITTELLAQTAPDIGITPQVSTETVITAVVLGIVAVTVAPVFTLRRLRRMDISSTLRVME